MELPSLSPSDALSSSYRLPLLSSLLTLRRRLSLILPWCLRSKLGRRLGDGIGRGRRWRPLRFPGRRPESPPPSNGGPSVSASDAWHRTTSSLTAAVLSGAWAAAAPAIASGTVRRASQQVKLRASAPARRRHLHVVRGMFLLAKRLAPAVGRLQPLHINLIDRGRRLLPIRMRSIWRLILGWMSLRLILACPRLIWGCCSLSLQLKQRR
ncbi:hypothetical protein ACUV84_034156 [Puccinellia chinampoensis]